MDGPVYLPVLHFSQRGANAEEGNLKGFYGNAIRFVLAAKAAFSPVPPPFRKRNRKEFRP